jgi:uncharacterized membrane protein (UPF0127 family)
VDLDDRFRGLDVTDLAGALRVVEARTRASRRLGLARLDALPAGYALRIPTLSVHTFGMRFALDLVWLRKDGTVVRVDHDVARRRMKLCARARAVIETNAGEGDRFAAALTPDS